MRGEKTSKHFKKIILFRKVVRARNQRDCRERLLADDPTNHGIPVQEKTTTKQTTGKNVDMERKIPIFVLRHPPGFKDEITACGVRFEPSHRSVVSVCISEIFLSSLSVLIFSVPIGAYIFPV